MKIIFVNRYFFPDNSATSQILTDLAFYLSSAGYEVHIVTGRSNYSDSSIIYNANEVINNVTVHRVWTTKFGRSNLIGRAVDYFSFYVSSFFRLLCLVKKSDLVVAKTDPPMISIVVNFVCFIKRAKYINWLQDLFPEVGESLGISALSGMLGRVLKYIRNISLKSAYSNVVIGKKMRELVNAEGVDLNKITVISNWSDINLDMRDKDNILKLRKEWNIGERFVVGYSGNFGRAHEYLTIVDVISKMRAESGLLFLFIGGGLYYDQLKKFVEIENIKNVDFRPYQPRDRLVDSLSLPDVHLVSLVSSLEGLIVPSKFYGIAAVGKPVIFVGNKDGEIATIIRTHNCGIEIGSGKADLLTKVILDLKSNTEQLKIYGDNAYKVYVGMYSKEIAQNKWKALVENAMH